MFILKHGLEISCPIYNFHTKKKKSVSISNFYYTNIVGLLGMEK